jgi:hypothetical protein
MVFGDYIPSERSENPGQEFWRVFLQRARLFAEAIN